MNLAGTQAKQPAKVGPTAAATTMESMMTKTEGENKGTTLSSTQIKKIWFAF